MRSIIPTVLLVGVMAAPLGAQGRGGWSQGRVPPGHMPPAGSCRVWYDGVPPGQQPPVMNCRDAERLASRSRNGRVIYGDDYRDNRGRYDDRYGRGGYDDGRYGIGTAAYQNGYRDGLDKGREDARDRDSYDPVRHSRYRSADHGYNSRYGSKDRYRLVYRDGFERGYREGYGQNRRGGGGIRLPF
jgi:hypothetical protein